MWRCLLLLLLFGLLLAGCSSRTAPRDVGGPVWPDLRADRRPRADTSSRDARPALPDLTLPDVAPPDRWTHDFRPELGPTLAWQKQPLLTAEDLHDVACVAAHVFVVGAQGTILHHAPSAPGFQPQVLPGSTAPELHAVSFAGMSYGAAAGKDTEIWKTTDLGATWEVASQCHGTLLDTVYGIHLSAVEDGFAVGLAQSGEGAAKYMNSSTGYPSWTCTTTYPSATFYDVFRLGKDGWAVGATGGAIYRTEDEGVSWSPVPAGTSQTLRGVAFVGATVGVAVGESGAIVRSTDGSGAVWAGVSSPTSAALWDLFFWDALSGWAVGASGTILHTGDGGVTWSTQKSGTAARLEAVCFSSATEGWVVGEKGLLLHTGTGGE